MKTLIDVQSISKLPHFSSHSDIVQVDSTDTHVLGYNSNDSEVQIRAEYLYSVCVDNHIEFAIVEDNKVASILSTLGIDTVQAI